LNVNRKYSSTPADSTSPPAVEQPSHETISEPADSFPFGTSEAEEGSPSGLERKRGRGRRLSESLRSAEEGELTTEQFLFVMAIEGFKRANNVSFPAWSDVLEVIRLLGYRKTQSSSIKLVSAEDWTEKADAASNVRPKGFERRLEPQDEPAGSAKPGTGKRRAA